jgi:type IV secretion system protein TrbF
MPVRNLLHRLRHGRRPAEGALAATGLAGVGPAAGFAVGDGAHGAPAFADAAPRVPAGAPAGASVRAVPNGFLPPPPHVLGRREFADRFTDLARARRNWQLVAFGALALLGVVTVAFVGLAASVRVQPFVVEVDELGQVRGFREVGDVYAAREAVTDATVRHFVRNLRTVYDDPAAQRDLIVSAYAFADADVQAWLNGYFSDPEHDPRLLARRLARRVEVKSVIRVPATDDADEVSGDGPESWKATWVEVETTRGTDTDRRTAWEGYFTVEQVAAAVRPENPLGLYVTAVNWSRVSPSVAR